MKEHSLGYDRVSNAQLIFCLKVAVLKLHKLNAPEVVELEKIIMERMKEKNEAESQAGVTNPGPFNPENLPDQPSGLLPNDPVIIFDRLAAQDCAEEGDSGPG